MMIFLDDLATPLLEVGVNFADTRDLDAGKLGSASQPQTDKRLKEVGRQVARYAYLHTSERAMEFLRLWECALLNPGGGRARE